MRKLVALLALVALTACTKPEPLELRAISCADPATWPNIPKGEVDGLAIGPTWSLEQGAEVLVEGSRDEAAAVKVTAEAARVVLRFTQPAPGTRVEASGQAECRWLNNLDLAVDFAGLQVGRPVKVVAAGITLTLIREKLPTVEVRGPDGVPITPGGALRPSRVPVGPFQTNSRQGTMTAPVLFTLTFDRAMNKQQVEEHLKATVKAPMQGETFGEVALKFTWFGNRQVELWVDGIPQWGYIKLPTAGLKARDGLETIGGTLEVVSAHVPVSWLNPTDRRLTPADGLLPEIFSGWWDAQLSNDGSVLLLREQTSPAWSGMDVPPDVLRFWLYRPAEDRLIPLPDFFRSGKGFALYPRVLPDGKGAIISDHATIWHYDGQGQRRMIWHDRGLIHTVAVSPVSGKLAIFLSRPLRGDHEIRLIVIDPAAPSPYDTSQTYGVVANVKGLDQESLRAEWAPDDSELLLTQGWCVAKGQTSRPCDRSEHESWRFSLASRQRTHGTTDFRWWSFSPDSQWLLATDDDVRMTLYQRDAKEPQVRYTSANSLWRFAEGKDGLFLWREWPFAWMDPDGGNRSEDQPWRPLGWAKGRFLVVPLER